MQPVDTHIAAIEVIRRVRPEGGDVELKFVGREADETYSVTVDAGSRKDLSRIFKDYAGMDAYLYPELPHGQGVAFVAACFTEARAVDWTGYRAPILIGRGDNVYAIWPLTEPADRDEALEALFARNSAAIDDPVPLPSGPDGGRVTGLERNSVERSQLEGCLLRAGSKGPEPRWATGKAGKKTRICGHGFEIFDDLDPEIAATEMAVSVTPGANNPNASRTTWSLNEMLTAFSVFPEREEKGGNGVVLGRLKGNRRRNEDVLEVSALGFDFDGAVELEAFDEAFAGNELLAVRYTTFSHGRTGTRLNARTVKRHVGADSVDENVVAAYLREKNRWAQRYVDSAHVIDETEDEIVIAHDPIAKFRLIVPLAEPLTPSALGVKAGKAFAARFKDLINGAIDELGLDGVDKSCTNIARMFYVPGVHPDGEASTRFFAGKLFDWRSITLSAARSRSAVASGGWQANSASRSKDTGAKRPATTRMGRRLGPWSAAAAERFDVRLLISDILPEDIRENEDDKTIVACPFEPDHTNPDCDDTACMATNPGWGNTAIFLINCLHDGCRDKNQLDMLGELIESGKVPISVLMDAAYYSEDTDMERVRTALLKAVETEDERATLLSEFIADVADDIQASDGPKLLRLVDKAAFNSSDHQSQLYTQISQQTVVDVDALMVADETPPLLPDGSQYQFDEPGYEIVRHDDGVFWIYKCGNEQKSQLPEPVCAALHVEQDEVLIDEEDDVRVSVWFHGGGVKWTNVCFSRGALARPVEVMSELANKGMRFSKLGRSFIPDFIARQSVHSVYRFSRAGWRTAPKRTGLASAPVFLAPSGETIPKTEHFGLRSDIRIGEDWARSGSLEEWRRLIGKIMAFDSVDHVRAGVLFGLAGPVLDLLKERPFSVLIEGESRSGKTEGVKLGAGHWGYPDHDQEDGLFNRANATKNAQVLQLVAGSGSMVGIDEIGKKDVSEQIDLIFDLEGGQDRARLNKDMKLARTRTWGGMVAMMTSETAFAERVKAEHASAPSGTAARFFPINAQDARILTGDELQIIAQAQRNYGHSGPAFVRAFVDHGLHLEPEKLSSRIDDHVIALAGRDAAPIKKSATRILAVMWLVGELARDLGLIADVYDIEGLARGLYESAQDYGLKPERPADRAIRELIDKIAREKGNRITAEIDERSHDRIGFYGRSAEADDVEGNTAVHEVYVLYTSAVDELTGRIVSKAALLKALYQRGILLRQPGREQKLNVWRGFSGLGGQDVSFVVLRADAIDGVEERRVEEKSLEAELISLVDQRSKRF